MKLIKFVSPAIGGINIQPSNGVITMKIKMNIPYGSSRANMNACRCGNRLTATRPPSSGGNGSMFKAISTTLILIPIWAISIIGSAK